MTSSKREEILDKVSPSRRELLRKAAQAGFVVPVVATFTMSGLLARPASAQANFSG